MSTIHSFIRDHKINIVLFLCAIAIGAACAAPFFFARYEPSTSAPSPWHLIQTHDMGTHYNVMQQFDKTLRSGVIYPRWLADTNYGYGVATMVYYPPNIFYLSSLIHIFVRDWTVTLFVLSALGLALSGFALYWLARLFFGRPASATAAFIYILLPYHQIDLYWRGALPELIGFIFIPLIIRFTYLLGTHGRPRHYAALGLLYGLYVMTHLPVSYIFTYALALYVGLWALFVKDWKILLRVGLGMMLGIGISAIYWLPAALESKAAYEWVSVVFEYHKSYLSPFSDEGDVFTHLIRKIYVYQFALLIVSVIVYFLAKLRSNKNSEAQDDNAQFAIQRQIWLWIVMSFVTILMVTKLSSPVSKLIPRIEVAVPPFRWLVIASAFLALVIAAALEHLFKRSTGSQILMWSYRTAMAAILILNLWLAFAGVMKGAMANPTYYPPKDFLDAGWIPTGAKQAEEMPQTNQAIIAYGGYPEIIRWDPEYREIKTITTIPAFLRLKTYNFPGWTAYVDGQVTPIVSDLSGAQTIQIPIGEHKVIVKFKNTPTRNFGTAISLLCLLGVCGLFVYDWKFRAASREKAEIDD
jgi:hypothetical protein